MYYVNFEYIDKTDVSNTSQFDFPSPVSSIYSQNSRFVEQYFIKKININSILYIYRRYIQPTQQRNLGNSYTRNTQYIILLFIGFFVVIFGLYFTSIQSSTVVLSPGN